MKTLLLLLTFASVCAGQVATRPTIRIVMPEGKEALSLLWVEGDGMTLSRACLIAGTHLWRIPKTGTITRGSKEMRFNLNAILDHPKANLDPVLLPGDVISFPERHIEF